MQIVQLGRPLARWVVIVVHPTVYLRPPGCQARAQSLHPCTTVGSHGQSTIGAYPMGDLSVCPTERPAWCAHPHCLYCNWDDDDEHAASAYAAHLGERSSEDRHYDPEWPGAHYIQDRM